MSSVATAYSRRLALPYVGTDCFTTLLSATSAPVLRFKHAYFGASHRKRCLPPPLLRRLTSAKFRLYAAKICLKQPALPHSVHYAHTIDRLLSRLLYALSRDIPQKFGKITPIRCVPPSLPHYALYGHSPIFTISPMLSLSVLYPLFRRTMLPHPR